MNTLVLLQIPNVIVMHYFLYFGQILDLCHFGQQKGTNLSAEDLPTHIKIADFSSHVNLIELNRNQYGNNRHNHINIYLIFIVFFRTIPAVVVNI